MNFIQSMFLFTGVAWVVRKIYLADEAKLHSTILKLFPEDYIVDSTALLNNPEIAEISKVVPPKWIIEIATHLDKEGVTLEELIAELELVRERMVKVISANGKEQVTPELKSRIKQMVTQLNEVDPKI